MGVFLQFGIHLLLHQIKSGGENLLGWVGFARKGFGGWNIGVADRKISATKRKYNGSSAFGLLNVKNAQKYLEIILQIVLK